MADSVSAHVAARHPALGRTLTRSMGFMRGTLFSGNRTRVCAPLRHQCRYQAGIPHSRHCVGSGRVPPPALQGWTGRPARSGPAATPSARATCAPNGVRAPSPRPGGIPCRTAVPPAGTEGGPGGADPEGAPLRHQCRVKAGIPHPRHRPGSGRGSCPASLRFPSDDTLTPRSATIVSAGIQPGPARIPRHRGHTPQKGAHGRQAGPHREAHQGMVAGYPSDRHLAVDELGDQPVQHVHF